MNIIGYHITDGIICNSNGIICREPPYLNTLLADKEEAIKVFYHLDYAIAQLLVLIKMTELQLRELNDTGILRTQKYKFKYIPKKFFSIGSDTQFTVFSNMSQYMDNWDLDNGDPIEKAYEAKRIAEEVYKALAGLGLHPKSLVSPIAVFEKEILNKLDLPSIEDIPEETSEYAYYCTHGPWVETFKKGHFEDTEDWDIRSAYPYQLSQLLDTRNGTWVKSSEYMHTAYYGYCHGLVDITSNFSPIIYSKANEQSFTPVGEWETYLTKSEIDFIYKYDIGTFELYDGWFWAPNKIVKPFEGLMNWLYHKKEQSSGIDKKIIKRIMSGTWGKLLSVNYDDTLGDKFNAVWGVEVESRTRLEVARFVLDNGLSDRLLSIAVDGVLVSKETK